MHLLSRLEHSLRGKASRWRFRMPNPEAGEVYLHHRRVFVMPTHSALGLLVMLLALLTASINYNLSLGFGLTFLIGSCAVIATYLTFRNLAHLHLVPGRVAPVFAGEEARFELRLVNRTRHPRYAIWLDFIGDGVPEVEQATDVMADSSSSVVLSLPARSRGRMPAPRVRLQTRFPLGLVRAWSYWRPDMHLLVYPQPEKNPVPLPMMDSDSKDGNGRAGQDDFAGVRSYQMGDSLKTLAWRQIAKMDADCGGQLVTKHFEDGGILELELDFAQLPAMLGLEQKLSRMTRWVMEAEARCLPYGFRLGSTVLGPALGPGHRDACLQALALYEAAA